MIATCAEGLLEFDERRVGDWISQLVKAEPIQNDLLVSVLLPVSLSIYYEETLIVTADRAKLLWPGATQKRQKNPPIAERDEESVAKDDIWLPVCTPELLMLMQEEGMEGLLPRDLVRVAYLYAGGAIIETPQGEEWTLHHAYDSRSLPNGERIVAADEELHFSQTAGIVSLHPVVAPLFHSFACVPNVIRAKLWRIFGYDPCGFFSGGQQNGRGFVDRKRPCTC